MMYNEYGEPNSDLDPYWEESHPIFDDDLYWVNQREADDYRNEFADEDLYDSSEDDWYGDRGVDDDTPDLAWGFND